MEPSRWIIEVETEDFERLVLQHQGLILIDFWAGWCHPCKMMDEVLREISCHFGQSLLVVKVNVDRNPELSDLFGIQSIPAFKVLYGKRLVAQWDGYRPEALMKRDLAQLFQTLDSQGE